MVGVSAMLMVRVSLVILHASHVTVAHRRIVSWPSALMVCTICRKEAVSSVTPRALLVVVVHQPIALLQSVPTACSTTSWVVVSSVIHCVLHAMGLARLTACLLQRPLLALHRRWPRPWFLPWSEPQRLRPCPLRMFPRLLLVWWTRLCHRPRLLQPALNV